MSGLSRTALAAPSAAPAARAVPTLLARGWIQSASPGGAELTQL